MATGEPWKVLLAHLLEYWDREGRAHRAQHLALLAADNDDQLDHPEVVAGLTFDRFVDPIGQAEGRPGRVPLSRPGARSGHHRRGRSRLMYPVGTDGVVTVGLDGVDPTRTS